MGVVYIKVMLILAGMIFSMVAGMEIEKDKKGEFAVSIIIASLMMAGLFLI